MIAIAVAVYRDMPLITTDTFAEGPTSQSSYQYQTPRRQSQHSSLAQTAMSRTSSRNSIDGNITLPPREKRDGPDENNYALQKHAEKLREGLSKEMPPPAKLPPYQTNTSNGSLISNMVPMRDGVGNAASDTPAPTAPSSPRVYV